MSPGFVSAGEARQCSAVSAKTGHRCQYVEHVGHVHVTFIEGWPTPWSSMPDGWQNVPLPHDPNEGLRTPT